jgi:hypothetical protein
VNGVDVRPAYVHLQSTYVDLMHRYVTGQSRTRGLCLSAVQRILDGKRDSVLRQ